MPRRLILILVALLISGGTFLLVQKWMQGGLGRSRPAASGRGAPVGPAIRILVARTAIVQGGLLTANSLRWQTWPSSDPPAPYLVEGRSRVQDVIGSIARSSLVPGQPLAAGGFVRPGDRGTLAAMLNPGFRAITVNVTPNTGNAGLVIPGDRVDLILTLTVPARDKDGPARHVSETILHDVRVAGLDESLSDNSKPGDKKIDKKEPPKTATLEVTPKQAEIVAVAADLGVLSLSLRSLGRTDEDGAVATPTHTWDNEAAQGVLGGPPSDRPSRPRIGPPQQRVVVVRGDASTEMLMAPRPMAGTLTS